MIEEPKRSIVGLKAEIRNGAIVGQDLFFFEWNGGDKIFTVQGVINEGKARLTAPGYGEPTNYGNGALWANTKDLTIFVKRSDMKIHDMTGTQEIVGHGIKENGVCCGQHTATGVTGVTGGVQNIPQLSIEGQTNGSTDQDVRMFCLQRAIELASTNDNDTEDDVLSAAKAFYDFVRNAA